MTSYATKVGLYPSNISDYLSGKKKITYATLEKLLSGTNLEVECYVDLVISQTGPRANDAPSPSLEEMLFSEELDRFTEELSGETTASSTYEVKPQTSLFEPEPPSQTDPSSFSSEKPLETKKTQLDFPFKDSQDESST